MLKALALSVFACVAAFAQVSTTARLDGTVKDPQGATVPGATIAVVEATTGQKFQTTTDEKGYWALPSLSTGTYKVTVTHEGFKSVTNQNVTLDAGVPATVNTTLQIGATTETVEVTAGAEMVQTDSAAVTSTLQGRQIADLPFTSHNVTELIAAQPGTSSPGGVRYSTINGLPQPTINITIDGINVQDNATKSNPDAIFNAVQPRTAAIEEMTMSTAAAGADSLGEGAVQIKFVTKGGSNTLHGSLYETNRNSAFEACQFFTCLQGSTKANINLNEFGFTVGGPVKKNKLFFFESFEFFFLPQQFSQTTTWLTPAAVSGVFSYNAGGVVRNVNLYALAAAANPSLPAGVRPFPTAVDPTLAKTYSLIAQLTANGTQVSRIGTNNDYNRYNFTWNPHAVNNRKFQTSRIDYNLNDKNHINFVWNYQVNSRAPDGLNGTYAILPGTGTQLGSPDLDGQYGINWTGSIGVRSVLTSSLTNEFSGGIQGGANALGTGLSPADYGIWKGYLVNFGGYMTNPYNGSYTGFAPRSTPVYQATDNMSYLHGNHLFNFGVNFTQVNAWSASANSSLLNTITLGQATGDPDNTGSTSLFTTTTLPGASATQLSDAANLYAILAGRVASTTSSAVLGETTKTYGSNFSVDRDHMRIWSGYGQDTWRVTPNLTVIVGLRWEHQGAIQNLDNLYTRPGFAGLYGVSGVGNLFKPGVLTGSVPVFSLVPPGVSGFDQGAGHFSPSFGIAYRIPSTGFLGKIGGNGGVLRGGFTISTIRQGIGQLDGVWNGNQGRTLSTSTSPSATPSLFTAGNVLFSDPSFPVQAPTSIDASFPNPSFPLAVQSGQSVSDYNPNIKAEYVESWTAGFQRPLGKNTVIEPRYVANHYVDGWASVNLNETNIIESGFLTQFQAAQNNLAIANGITVSQLLNPQVKLTVNNYGNTGLPGQVNVPLLTTAIGSSTDQTTVTQLQQGQAGSTANGIAGNSTRMSNLTKAGYSDQFVPGQPQQRGRGNHVHQPQLEHLQLGPSRSPPPPRRGFQLNGSYAWAKCLTDANSPTLRDWGGEKGPSTFDIRNGIQSHVDLSASLRPGSYAHALCAWRAGKVVSGWEIAGVGAYKAALRST